MTQWWAMISDWIALLGVWGILIILIIAMLHPTFEAPAALLLLTLLSLLVNSVWLASGLLLIAYSIGWTGFYYLVHDLHRRSGEVLFRFRPSKKAFDWIKAQPKWKHILIIGMPLVYTYPLRVAFTLQHKHFISYWIDTLLQYTVLTVGNLLLYFGIVQILLFDLPLWSVTLILVALSVTIYAIRQKKII